MLIKTSVERSHTSDAVLHKPDGLDSFFLFSLWFLASNLLVSVYIGTELKALTLTAAREFWERKYTLLSQPWQGLLSIFCVFFWCIVLILCILLMSHMVINSACYEIKLLKFEKKN
jgi:hypothetical protein